MGLAMNKSIKIALTVVIPIIVIVMLYAGHLILNSNDVKDTIENIPTTEYGDDFSINWDNSGLAKHFLVYNEKHIIRLRVGKDADRNNIIEGVFRDDDFKIYKVNNDNYIYTTTKSDEFKMLQTPDHKHHDYSKMIDDIKLVFEKQYPQNAAFENETADNKKYMGDGYTIMEYDSDDTVEWKFFAEETIVYTYSWNR